MRRVVVTGLGIISCIGNTKGDVLRSLREGRSGITFCEEYKEMGFRSHVYGKPNIDLGERVDRRSRRFMGDGAAYNYVAMQDAIDDSGMEKSDVSNVRTALIMGSGGPSTSAQVLAADNAREKGPKKVGPFVVPKAMTSTNSAKVPRITDLRTLALGADQTG